MLLKDWLRPSRFHQVRPARPTCCKSSRDEVIGQELVGAAAKSEVVAQAPCRWTKGVAGLAPGPTGLPSLISIPAVVSTRRAFSVF